MVISLCVYAFDLTLQSYFMINIFWALSVSLWKTPLWSIYPAVREQDKWIPLTYNTWQQTSVCNPRHNYKTELRCEQKWATKTIIIVYRCTKVVAKGTSKCTLGAICCGLKDWVTAEIKQMPLSEILPSSQEQTNNGPGSHTLIIQTINNKVATKPKVHVTTWFVLTERMQLSSLHVTSLFRKYVHVHFKLQ